MRYLLIPVMALSLTTATAAFAATGQTTGTAKQKTTANAETCTRLESQFDKAVDMKSAKPSALKKAKVQREKAASYCKKNETAKGAAMLRSALAKLGQKPQA